MKPFTSLILLTALFNTAVPVANACALATPTNSHGIAIAEESAVIVWNSKRHVEHFIRRATFEGAGSDFGFLVPTPSVPQLVEANDGLFTAMEGVIAPRQVDHYVNQYYPSSLLFPESAISSTAPLPVSAPMAPVTVISTTNVAGYQATVLAADNADALADWLKAHGYVDRPQFARWLAPYVAQHWKITAFKIMPPSHSDGLTRSKAVRMTFHADHPYFPYREPDDARTNAWPNDSRLLRVFFIDDAKATGAIGLTKHGDWAGKTVWANALPRPALDSLQSQAGLTGSEIPAGAYLTAFEDSSSPRPGYDDLFFAPASDYNNVTPAPVVHVHVRQVGIPIEPFILAFLIGATVIAFRANRAKQRRSASV